MTTAKRYCKTDGCTRTRQGSPYCRAHAELAPDVPRCDYPGCGYARLQNGLCQRHVAQLRRGIELKPVVDWSRMPCRFRLCDNQAAGRGRYCVQHARQVHKGVPLTPLLVGTPCARSGCEEVSRSNLGLCPTHVNLNGHLVREYGITLAQRDELAAAQNGVCAICGGSDGEDLHVDHCHASGAVRGLLCGPCNRALGLMQDDPARLLAAAAYLRA